MNEKSRTLKVLTILSMINLIPLLPCAYLTILKIISLFTEVGMPWSRLFLGFTLPVVFLRCFFLPYITSAVINIVHFCILIKNKFPLKETIIFAILLIICITGLLSVEDVFWAAMGI